MKKALMACSLALVGTVGCAPPIESVSTRIDIASVVQLINAPDGATLSIGEEAADAEDGIAMLSVPDGWHDVAVYTGGRLAFSRRVFVQDGSRKVIDFSAPN